MPEPSAEMLARAREWMLLRGLQILVNDPRDPAYEMQDTKGFLSGRIARYGAERYAEGVTAGREEAAKLVEDHGHSNGRIRASHKHLAAAIRRQQ